MDPSNFTKKIYRMESEIVDLNNKYLKLLHASKSDLNILAKNKQVSLILQQILKIKETSSAPKIS